MDPTSRSARASQHCEHPNKVKILVIAGSTVEVPRVIRRDYSRYGIQAVTWYYGASEQVNLLKQCNRASVKAFFKDLRYETRAWDDSVSIYQYQAKT